LRGLLILSLLGALGEPNVIKHEEMELPLCRALAKTLREPRRAVTACIALPSAESYRHKGNNEPRQGWASG
jgi:hypothetical protein